MNIANYSYITYVQNYLGFPYRIPIILLYSLTVGLIDVLRKREGGSRFLRSCSVARLVTSGIEVSLIDSRTIERADSVKISDFWRKTLIFLMFILCLSYFITTVKR